MNGVKGANIGLQVSDAGPSTGTPRCLLIVPPAHRAKGRLDPLARLMGAAAALEDALKPTNKPVDLLVDPPSAEAQEAIERPDHAAATAPLLLYIGGHS